MRVFVAASAEADIDSILGYFGARNPAATAAMLGRVGAAASLLGEHPHLGRAGRVSDTREFAVTSTPFVLVYRVGVDALTVLRVLHSSREWPPA